MFLKKLLVILARFILIFLLKQVETSKLLHSFVYDSIFELHYF